MTRLGDAPTRCCATRSGSGSSTGGWRSALIAAGVSCRRRDRRRLRAAEAPGRRPQPATSTFKPQKPKRRTEESAARSTGRCSASTRPAPATCRRGAIKPPFRKLWRYTERPLLEFPPIYVGGTLYAVNNNGYAFALDADTGKVLWERRIGRLNASSPAYYHHRLYIVNLVPGHIVKLDAKTGKVIWKRSLPGRAESSPVVIGRSVYFGCENGELFALSTRQRQRPLVDPARRRRSSRRRPTTAAASTSATTAAT